MANGRLTRLGGLCGILYVLLFIPAYIVGYPDAPAFTSGPGEEFAYFGGEYSAFLFFNGVLPIFSAFFLSWFVGILHGVLRRVEGEEGGASPRPI